MAHEMPHTPVALGVSGSTLGLPWTLGTALTVWQRAKTAMTRIAPKPPLPPWAPLAPERDMGIGFHPDDARETPLVEYSKQGHVSTTPIGRHDDAACAHGLGYPAHCTADDRQVGAVHSSVYH